MQNRKNGVEVSTVPGRNGDASTSTPRRFPSPAGHVNATYPSCLFFTVRDSEYWAKQRSLTFSTPKPESAPLLYPW